MRKDQNKPHTKNSRRPTDPAHGNNVVHLQKRAAKRAPQKRAPIDLTSQWVAGIHSVNVALSMAKEHSAGPADLIVELHLDPARKNQRLVEIAEEAEKIGVHVAMTPSEQISKLCGTDHHQGVCAKVMIPAIIDEVQFWGDYYPGWLEDQRGNAYEEGCVSTAPLLLILDQVQDTHNLGACLRSANAAGATALVIPKHQSATYSAQVAKAASGATLETPIVEVNSLANFLRKLQKEDFWLVGFSDEAEQDYLELDYQGPHALIMGGEHAGARRLTQEICDHLVSIPMQGCVGSLNVSVAAGVALFGVVGARLKK